MMKKMPKKTSLSKTEIHPLLWKHRSRLRLNEEALLCIVNFSKGLAGWKGMEEEANGNLQLCASYLELQ